MLTEVSVWSGCRSVTAWGLELLLFGLIGFSVLFPWVDPVRVSSARCVGLRKIGNGSVAVWVGWRPCEPRCLMGS